MQIASGLGLFFHGVAAVHAPLEPILIADGALERNNLLPKPGHDALCVSTCQHVREG